MRPGRADGLRMNGVFGLQEEELRPSATGVARRVNSERWLAGWSGWDFDGGC